MFFSLREFLWLKFYGGTLPPENLISREIIISVVVALVILLCWWGIRRVFFLIAQRAKNARGIGVIFCICWSVAWLTGSLEPAGYRSFNLMVILMFLSLAGSAAYLVWVRKR